MLSPVSSTTVRVRRLRSRGPMFALPVLLAVVVLLTGLSSSSIDARWAPVSLLVVPLLAGGLVLLRRRDVTVVTLAVFAGALVVVGIRGEDVPPSTFLVL